MPTYQDQNSGYLAYKVQSGLGSAASGSGATILRQTGGNGARMAKAAIESNEVRRDGMRPRGRHGTQATTGAWTGEVSLGSHDDVLEAVMRGTWSTDLTLDEGDFTSLTTGANTIILTSGDPRSLGLAIGDVIRLADFSTAGNNDRNLRITGLDATTITVAETLTVNGSADTDCSIVRVGKKLINPASLVKRYFTLEEYEAGIDESELFTDFVWGSIKLSMAPDGLLMADVSGVGTGQFAVEDNAAAPVFTSPTLGTAIPLAVLDASIRVGANDVVDLTSFDITIDIAPNAPKVIASKYSPDVFAAGQMAVTINLTALRKDLAYVSDYLDETPLSLQVLAVTNDAEPKDFLSIFVPNFTLGGVDKSALNKASGPRTQTISIPPALVGFDDIGTGHDFCMVKLQSSAS